MPANASPLTALILGIPGVVSMGIARGWLMAGHRIASIWYPERLKGSRSFRQDELLARTAPGVTLHGLAARSRIAVRPVAPLAKWPEAVSEARRTGADIIISLLYPDRIPPGVIDAFPGRVFNLHPSLLPAYRGPEPVFNMLWDRTIDAHSGFTLHLVSPDFDKGDVLGRERVAFPADRNLSAYYMYLVKAGAALAAGHIPPFVAGRAVATPQDGANAPQGNRKARDARIGPGICSDHIAWLCSTIPQMMPLRIEGLGDDIHVTGFQEKSGPPTGEPPVEHGNQARVDASDARVILRITRAAPR